MSTIPGSVYSDDEPNLLWIVFQRYHSLRILSVSGPCEFVGYACMQVETKRVYIMGISIRLDSGAINMNVQELVSN